ncbi:serine/threonine protein kinase [Chromobacterium piscinae]|uniref:serine/threonine protein kinase n=1 Tax=Chromobacterium piscinae TaxID=686831 RepID=UPI001E2F589F|nr:hypothetical protein [Chromobacterium piscinae]MCD5329926.1 hypothetical protein [Chromobacterium piscinae]
MGNAARKLDVIEIHNLFPQINLRFDLEEQIGEPSGFGAVWLAYDRWLDREVALKISQTDLSSEILLCRDIEGQTVRIYDYFRGENGWHAYSMELLHSSWRTLSSWIETHRYREHDLQHYFDCLEVMYDALRGLAAIHGRPYSREGRYVHADIKPANLFFLCQPKKRPNTVFRMPAHQDMVKIIDMGISTQRGGYNNAGTPAYDYPYKQDCRPGHDLYSLGLTFLEMLSGTLPTHHTMEHKTRITTFVTAASSGSAFIDNLAIELARQCARAATQLAITARSLLAWLDEKLFELNEANLLLLRSIHHHLLGAMKKDELASAAFPYMAAYFGWKNQTVGRIEFLKVMIADMYAQGLLVRDGSSYRYFVR